MTTPRIALYIEPDGVRADEYVVAVAVDDIVRERATWRTLETALAQAETRLLRLAYQVFR